MHAEPQAEHQWLQRLVGDWTFESQCSMGPGQEPQTFHGKETVRTLGGLWIMADGEGEMPGGGIGNMVITLGYDPQKQRYVGTFVGSMMTHLWLYDGALVGNVLTLDAEGPSMSGDGTLSKYQDIIEMLDDNRRTLTSRVQLPDGTWNQFMVGHYRRK